MTSTDALSMRPARLSKEDERAMVRLIDENHRVKARKSFSFRLGRFKISVTLRKF